jgi:hypothetical protein
MKVLSWSKAALIFATVSFWDAIQFKLFKMIAYPSQLNLSFALKREAPSEFESAFESSALSKQRRAAGK